MEKIFKFMEFTFLENALIRGIFTNTLSIRDSPPHSCRHALDRRKLHITFPYVAFFQKSDSLNGRSGENYDLLY